ncbi:MAG: sensor histidine kinase [Eubacteriales bacterium]|nr:sensor histidine kinase [Eubacteriales bacterium]
MLKKWNYFWGSFRGKIMAIFLAFSLVTAIGLGVFCYFSVFHQMLSSTAAYSGMVANQISKNAGMIMEQTGKILMIGNSSDISDFLYDTGTRHETTMGLISMVKLYRDSYVFSDDIKNFYVLGNDGVCFNEKLGIYPIEKSEKSQYIYNMIQENEGELMVLSGFEMGWEDRECFLIGQKIRQTFTNKTMGIIAIELDANAVKSVYEQEVLGESGYFTLFDRKGNELFHYDGTAERSDIPLREEVFSEDKGSYQKKTESGTMLVVYDRIQGTDWVIVGQAPLRELMAPTYQLGRVFFAAILLTLAFLGALYYYLSKRLTKPITELKDKMLLAEQGDLDATVAVARNDEIAILQRQYNQMLTRIKDLMEENREEQRNMQKAELKALQAQINPHFLYNTLELVIWLAASEENDQVIDVVDKLAVFFKTGLSKGLEWIPVKKEIEHVESYLSIQQKRYSDLLSFEIRVDPDICQYCMLKMVLQPIVENAIYHGIKNREEGGKITVIGEKQGDLLLFTVEDTGCGMETEVLEELRQKIRENTLPWSDHENGFGIYNVNRRILLYYGKECGVDIQSEKDRGTRVTIRLKCQVEGQEHV